MMISLSPDEHIVKVVRRHWFAILGFCVSIFLFALAPCVLFQIFKGQSYRLIDIVGEAPLLGIENFLSTHSVFAYSIWLLVLWIVFFVEWTDYYLDAWVITNKRIIDVEQRGFFHRNVTSFLYEQIQDITVDTKGIIATFFKFGTLHIHTAGSGSSKTHDDIIIHHADKPEEIRSIILREQEKSYRTRDSKL